MFSSGRLPVRHPQVDMGLPTNGTGKYEWRGFIAAGRAPARHRAQRRCDHELEQQAGDRLAGGRRQLGVRLRAPRADAAGRDPRGSRRTRSGPLVSAMNRAATQDFRDEKVMRAI